MRGAIWLLAAEVREWADHESEPLMTQNSLCLVTDQMVFCCSGTEEIRKEEKGKKEYLKSKPTWQNLGFQNRYPCRRILEITIVAGAALPSPNKLHLMSQEKLLLSFGMPIDRHSTDTTADID